MSKTHNVVVPLALLVSVLALSACATKEEPAPVAEPAPVTAAAEAPSAQEAAPVLADDQHRHGLPEGEPAIVEEPAPEQVAPPPAKKKVVRAKRIPPKAVPPAPEPEPVIAPAPVEIPAVQPPEPEPAPPEPIAPPAQEVVDKGFLEEYWLWLLGLVVAVVGIAVWRLKGQSGKS